MLQVLGLDPGYRDIFTASDVNEQDLTRRLSEQTMQFSSKRYRCEAGITASGVRTARTQQPGTLYHQVTSDLPTAKTPNTADLQVGDIVYLLTICNSKCRSCTVTTACLP